MLFEPDHSQSRYFTTRIVSGGQTGADRAALDFALEHGYPHGGFCPQGRKAEDGFIPPRYGLVETESAGYRQRTRRNIEGSDGTLILNLGEFDGGSLETERIAVRLKKPVLVVQLDDSEWESERLATVLAWIREHAIGSLNVAGPRESKRPGVYNAARAFLGKLTASSLSRRLS